MRKLISGLFVSLDGVVENPGEWQGDVFDDDMVDAMTRHLADEDTMLLGRVTYQEWAPVLALIVRRTLREPHQQHPKIRRLDHAKRCLVGQPRQRPSHQKRPCRRNRQAQKTPRQEHRYRRQPHTCSLVIAERSPRRASPYDSSGDCRQGQAPLYGRR